MSLLPLIDKALLSSCPKVMPQVLLHLEHKRNLEAAKLLHSYTLLPLADIKQFIEHHLRGEALPENYPSGILLTAVQQAVMRSDTERAIALITAERNKAALAVRYTKPNSTVREMASDLLVEGTIWFVGGVALLVGLLMWFDSLKW